MSTITLESAWNRQKEWSETANQFKSSLLFWRKVVLALAITAAVFGTLSGTFDTASNFHRWTSILAAVAASASPVIAQMYLGQKNIEKWIRARSASEAYKAEIFQYRTGTGDYQNGDRAKTLSDSISQIDKSVENILSVGAQDLSIPTDKLQNLSIPDYIDQRVGQQIRGYYRPKAIFHAKIAQRYRKAHVVLMLVGAILGGVSAAATSDVGIGPWIAVVTTVASSLQVHSEASRHDYLAISFRATAHRLEEIVNPWLDTANHQDPSPAKITQLVAECENVISIENQSWHAKFSSPLPKSNPQQKKPHP